jgi:acetyltransferase-like isoleucine patch superfamily enzyme
MKKNALVGIGRYGDRIYVNGPTVLNQNTFLGTNVNFNGLKVIGTGRVEIGDNFHSGLDCVLITDTHNFKGTKIPYDETYIVKDIIIEDNVWLGHGVIILGGVRIGEGAIIQAGAVVVKNIPPLAIAGGNPAIVFKERDREHYFSLKSSGSFH